MKSICNDTGKVIFFTRREAADTMVAIRRIVKKRSLEGKRIKYRCLKPRPRRVYYCEFCKGYHLSSWSWWWLGTKRAIRNRELSEQFHTSCFASG